MEEEGETGTVRGRGPKLRKGCAAERLLSGLRGPASWSSRLPVTLPWGVGRPAFERQHSDGHTDLGPLGSMQHCRAGSEEHGQWLCLHWGPSRQGLRAANVLPGGAACETMAPATH